MAVETDFSFAQEIPGLAVAGVGPPPDLLGLLRPFVGKPAGGKDAKRSWKGTGFNMIWRPNFGGEFGPTDFFLQLNLTDEQLDFTEITGNGELRTARCSKKTVVLGGGAATRKRSRTVSTNPVSISSLAYGQTCPRDRKPCGAADCRAIGSIPARHHDQFAGCLPSSLRLSRFSRLPASRLSGSEAPTTARADLVPLCRRGFHKGQPVTYGPVVRVASPHLRPIQKSQSVFCRRLIAKQKIDQKNDGSAIVVRRSGSGGIRPTSPRRRWRRGVKYRVSRKGQGTPAYRRP